MRLERGISQKEGAFGIHMAPSYPVKKSDNPKHVPEVRPSSFASACQMGLFGLLPQTLSDIHTLHLWHSFSGGLVMRAGVRLLWLV